MATKQEVTDFIDDQFEDVHTPWWTETVDIKGSRLSMVQNWMAPEIAEILQKLVGDAFMISRIAKNRSNK